MFRHSISLGALLAASIAWSAPAAAGVKVEPMSYDLLPSGSRAKQDLRVENSASKPSAVEVRISRREILPDGTDRLTPADDDFLVFPPQAILPPNGYQTFRVQYVGDPRIAETQLYLVSIAQLPVSGAGASETGVQIVYEVGTVAAVSPEGSKPDIRVAGVRPAADPESLEITVENRGTRYTRLKNGVWTLRSARGAEEEVAGEPLRVAIGNSLIEPGKTRVITLPVSDGFAREGATASFAPAAGR